MGNSLTVFVKDHCACWKDKMCLGVDVWNKAFNNSRLCWIFEKKACPYFQRCVLPIAHQKGTYTKLARLYSLLDQSFAKTEVRRCGCGAELQRRRRLCDKCARRHRQDTYRNIRHKLNQKVKR
ncbi:MAG: hypothetical protein A2Y12_05030 [Planctomycetes bacterium GWF2_42_9]|nr:MAG: hypothetical protein A2Y12_05030 [Planctomycetes bacterium GWF2_42_9]